MRSCRPVSTATRCGLSAGRSAATCRAVILAMLVLYSPADPCTIRAQAGHKIFSDAGGFQRTLPDVDFYKRLISKESLDGAGLARIAIYAHGVQGVECSNHSVPTNRIKDLAKAGEIRLFLFLEPLVLTGAPNANPILAIAKAVDRQARAIAALSGAGAHFRIGRAPPSAWRPRNHLIYSAAPRSWRLTGAGAGSSGYRIIYRRRTGRAARARRCRCWRRAVRRHRCPRSGSARHTAPWLWRSSAQTPPRPFRRSMAAAVTGLTILTASSKALAGSAMLAAASW